MLSLKNETHSSFTLVFVDEEEEAKEEDIESNKINVTTEKGKSLSELVEPVLVSRDKSFENYSLFLESSANPLPLNGDAFHYAGTILYVKKRVSTCAKTRFTEILEQYEKDIAESGLTLDELVLEERWQDIITESDEMSERQKALQDAIWELFTSEAEFIKELHGIVQIFQNSFKLIQDGGCMTEVGGGVIFVNIVEVFEVNVTFWRRLKDVIDDARASMQPICPNRLIETFNGFEQLFQPYISFCNIDMSNLKLPSSSPTTSGMTEQYIQWCDPHGTCRRITMAGFLVKPLQRVTKYSNLLNAILNKTVDDKVRAIIGDMTSRIERFVSKINKSVHQRQGQEKLNSVVNRLANYNPVDLGSDETEQIIKEFCNLNLKGPIPGLPENEQRLILKEGPMKLVEKQGKKEFYAFLFSDVFVITKLKKNADKYCIHRPPYRVNKIRVHELKDPGQLLFIYINEYGVVADAFILQVVIDEQQKWKTALQTAKENYETIRNKFAFQQECWDHDLLTSALDEGDICRTHSVCSEKENLDKIEHSPVKTERRAKTESLATDENVYIIAGAALFIVLNIIISRLMG